MELRSTAFGEGDFIPKQHTCDGPNVSPPLQWSHTPANTKSLAILCEDPDAPRGSWVHWILFDIPPTVSELQGNILKTRTIPNGSRQGINDFHQIGYGGPCPPSGTHRYFFRLYALDVVLDRDPGITRNELESSMQNHILAEAHIMGKYRR